VSVDKAMSKKILVVDDDVAFLRLVEQALTAKGYEMLKAVSGQEALRLLFCQKPDMVLLDLAMPGMDGWQTCSRIRDLCNIPVIMLTGQHTTEKDIVRGLDYGADDYLIKPVGNKELEARVRTVLRRAELSPSLDGIREVTYSDNQLMVDVVARRIILNGKRVRLTPTEFRLLALLVENAGRVLTHKQLLEMVWGWEYVDDIDYVRIYIWHLRQRIEPDPTQHRYIMRLPKKSSFPTRNDI